MILRVLIPVVVIALASFVAIRDVPVPGAPPAAGGETRIVEVTPARGDAIVREVALGVRLSARRDETESGTLASCTTCHAARAPNFANAAAADLDQFHAGLEFAHGSNRCLSCHDPANYDRFRLADGSAVLPRDVQQLCAQCHAAKVDEYEHGAHGGMNGYWDTKRGPRNRNHCVDCHDPHAPAFPRMVPTFKPLDRFLTRTHEEHDR